MALYRYLRGGYRIAAHAGEDGMVDLSKYDVVRNLDDKVMNDQPLPARAAERLAMRLPAVPIGEPEELRPIMPNKKIRWRKLGSGSFRMRDGRIIKQNQIFEATVDDIPMPFRDIVVPVDPLPIDPPLEIAGPGYRIVAKVGGWYDVVDAQGKRLN